MSPHKTKTGAALYAAKFDASRAYFDYLAEMRGAA